MKKGKKLLSVLLALAMVFTTVSVSLVASAEEEAAKPSYKVELPQDYTMDIIKEMVPAANTMVAGLLETVMGGKTLMTNYNLNAVLSLVLPMLYGESGFMQADVADVAGNMDEGNTLSQYVAAHPDATWANLDYQALDWGITPGSTQQFAEVIGSTLRGVLIMAGGMLVDAPADENGEIPINIDFGNILQCKSLYRGLVYPILTALELDGVMTPEEYTKDYNDGLYVNGDIKALDRLVSHILIPVLELLEDLVANPINVLGEKLPVIANAVVSGKLDTILNLVSPGLKGAELDLAKTINDLLAQNKIDLILPAIDLNKLVGQNVEDTFMIVLDYLYSIITNEATVNSLMKLLAGAGLDQGTMDTINGVLGQFKGMQRYEFYDLLATLTGVEPPEHPEAPVTPPTNGGDKPTVDIPQTGDAVISAFAVMSIAAAAAFVATKKKKEN